MGGVKVSLSVSKSFNLKEWRYKSATAFACELLRQTTDSKPTQHFLARAVTMVMVLEDELESCEDRDLQRESRRAVQEEKEKARDT